LFLVMSLGLVIILMGEARKPQRWQWLWSVGGAAGADADNAAGKQVDTRLHPAPDEELPGTFIAPAPGGSDEPSERKHFPGVRQDYLESVRDNTPSRRVERDAMFHLLALLEANDESSLRKASVGPVSFVQLYDQPDEYRGELVTIRGTLRRANRLRAPRNDYGVESYYQTWIQPADQPDAPIVVYCLALPDGFPTGMDLAEPVEITGFFFKRWAYMARDAMRTAPLLLARTVGWQKPVAPPPERVSYGVGPLILGVALAFVGSVLVSVYVYRVQKHPKVGGGQS
jgi:hypothetical protein